MGNIWEMMNCQKRKKQQDNCLKMYLRINNIYKIN